MKLTYKVLWVDDRIEEAQYKEMVERLQQFLSEEEFFDAMVIAVEGPDDFEKYLDSEYDLIITDYNLGEKNGDYIIQYTREKGILTEVFFYSANSTLTTVTGLANNSRVTFHQMTDPNGYRELFSQIRSLIDLTIKKFQHVISMRGLVMAETSEIDILMEETLRGILIGEEDAIKAAKKVIKDKFIESQNEHLAKRITPINEVTEFDKLLREVGAYHRWRAMKRNFPAALQEEFKFTLDNYQKDIMAVRDVLAHAKYFKTEEGEFLENKVPDGDPHKFDVAKCKEIRKNLNVYKKALLLLKDKVKN